MKDFLNKIFKKSYFPWVFQVIMLVIAILLIMGGWGIQVADKDVLTHLRNTNLANLLVWSYWWPILILVTVFFGRLWCTVCPVELLSKISSRLGLKREPSRFIKSRWIVVILYAFISIVAVRYWNIHRQPHYMALYILIAMSASVVVGLIYKERTFCKYFCPVGLILSFYSLMSKWGIHVKKTETCKDCKMKNCMNRKAPQSFVAAPCLSNVNIIDEKHDKRHCQLCMQCIKLCPDDNISYTRLSHRSYFLMNLLKMRSAELAMAILVIAYSFHEAVAKLPVTKVVIKWFASIFTTIIPNEIVPEKVMDGISLFIFLPVLCMALFAALNTLISDVDFKTSFKYAVAFLLPMGVIGELNKGVFKMLSRFPYIKYSLADFDGQAYAQAIADKTIVVDKVPFYGPILMVVGLIVFTWAMVVIVKKIRQEKQLTKPSQYLFILFAGLYYVIAGLYPAIMRIM